MRQMFAIVACADESGGLPAPIGSVIEVVLTDDFGVDEFIQARMESWILVKRADGNPNSETVLARKLQLKSFLVA